VWHEYDVPTVGTFNVNDATVLFTVVGSPEDALSVWAYSCLSSEDAETLRQPRFASLTDLNEAVFARFEQREAVFALARDLRVWRWTRAMVNGPGEDDLVEAATRVLMQVKEQMEAETQRQPSPNVPFRAALADVEATAEELVDA
jgi:hypothetical protein